MNPSHIEEIVRVLNAHYPRWEGLSDPRFVDEEIDYKREAIKKARFRINRSALEHLMEGERYSEIVERLEDLGKEPHFLYLSTPRSGDLNVLYHPDLDQAEFCRQVLDLLHGVGSPPERLDRYAAWIESQNLSNKWTFPTYFLFLIHPEDCLFVKPRAVGNFLKLVEADFELGSQPSGDIYERLLTLARELQEALGEEEQADDLVPIQSIIWKAGYHAQDVGALSLKEKRLESLHRLLGEFAQSYVDSEEGRNHLARYEEIREAGRRNFQEVLSAEEAGQDITDMILTKLLPHRDIPALRAKGAWTHVAPAIAGDVKAWFENAGWVDPEDWPQVSRTLLAFIKGVPENPDDLATACRRLAQSEHGKGFQTGMLTPILSALMPERFILINNKSRAVVNYFLDLSYKQSITDYPELNKAAHYLLQHIRPHLRDILPSGATPEEGFDAFSHWLVAEKGFRFGRSQAWRIDAESPEAWRAWRSVGFAGLSAPLLTDVLAMKKRDWEEQRTKILEDDEDAKGEELDEVWTLGQEVQEGDLILATLGTDQLLGIGMVVGPYEYHDGEEPEHRVAVEWHDTETRAISEPGWQGRFHPVEQKKVEKLRDIPPLTSGEGLFSPRTFELLEGLRENPTRNFHSEHLDDFRTWVEEPVQDLLTGVAALLPRSMTEILETDKRLFSRIPKNDYGRGGAWDFYWGALYPRGEKRISSAQLYVWLNRNYLEYGFFIGEYGGEQRARFLKNVRKQRKTLANALGSYIDDGFVFGALRREDGSIDPETALDSLEEWLEELDEGRISVRTRVDRHDLLRLSETELRDRILSDFQQLFPLVLLAVSDDPMGLISEYVGPEDEVEIQPDYPLEACAGATGFGVQDLRRWVRAIHRKGQAIFYGPPGTGKTFMAEHLARHLIGGGDGFTELVQFHPAYAYEDFIQGIRPETRTDGALEYRMKPGRFLEFCRKAQNRSGTCVLVIDEINRANLSRVFGELMFLLEYREEEVPLSGDGTLFRIPDNVRIVGTMNTADRSIALVDHALRRRFAFLALRPEFEVLRGFHEERGRTVEPLIEKVTQVNNAIGDPNYHVGITFFLDPELEDNLEAIWTMEIEPYLEEFFFDDPATVDRFRWKKVARELEL